METKLKNIFDKLKGVGLSPDEKSKIRFVLLDKIERDLLSQKSKSPILSTWWRFASYRNFQITSIALLVLFVGGAVFGAQTASPGNILYPVKTSINENFRRLFHKASSIDRVNFEVEILNTRLEEMNQLQIENDFATSSRLRMSSGLVQQKDRLEKVMADFFKKKKKQEKAVDNEDKSQKRDKEDDKNIIIKTEEQDISSDATSTPEDIIPKKIEMIDDLLGEDFDEQVDVSKEEKNNIQEAKEAVKKATDILEENRGDDKKIEINIPKNVGEIKI